MSRFRIFVFAALFFATSAPLAAMSIAGRQNRREFMAQVTEAFVEEDYATLESTAADLRARKDRFPDGVWTLPAFYDALELGQLPDGNVDDRLAHWKAAFQARSPSASSNSTPCAAPAATARASIWRKVLIDLRRPKRPWKPSG